MHTPVSLRHVVAAATIPIAMAIASPVLAATVAQPWQVIGESMEPVIQDRSMLLVDAVGPELTGYARGDIVVLTVPEGAARGYPVLVKRIVGLPGDRVAVRDGRVSLNGTPIREPYLEASDARMVHEEGEVQVVVPAGTVWVMGDHRSNSFDSTAFGPVPVGQLLGRVWVAVEPDGDIALGPASTPASAAGS